VLQVFYDDAAAAQAVTGPLTDAQLRAASVPVTATAYRSALDFTRPANVTAYTAGDVIGTGTGNDAVLTLASIGPSGGHVLVQSVELVIGVAAIPTGMTTFRLHFYQTQPTAIADNAAFNFVSGDRSVYAGYVDVPVVQDFGNTLFAQNDAPGKMLTLASGSTSYFCVLQTVGGFTPGAVSEAYSLRVKTIEAGR
jgi:hypothetical protein